MGKKKFAFSLMIILVLSAFGVLFFNNDITPDSNIEYDILKDTIIFHEIYYSAENSDEFIELLSIKNENLSYNNLKLNITGNLYDLPALTNVNYFTYIVIYFSSGNNDTDGTDDLIEIYLDTGINDNLENIGNSFLIYGDSTVLDFIKWGGLTHLFLLNQIEYLWRANDNGPKSLVNESIQLFGLKSGSSVNWLSSKPTPGFRNALQFTILNLGLTIIIENGASELGTIEIERPSARWNETIKYWNRTGKPVDAPVVKMVQEMVSFTAQYYNELGFPSPVSRNGTIHVVLENGTSPASTAGASSSGVVTISVGTNYNQYELKLTVEHELMHLVQWHRSKNAQNETVTNMPDPANKNNWWEEGMAEYWGVRSTMENYNVTMETVQNATRLVDSANWWVYGRNLNRSTFSDWGYGWSDYTNSFLFIKYLIEHYGMQNVTDIHNGAQNNIDNATKSVSAQESLEKVLGKSLNEILQEYYSWRTFNKQNNELPSVFVNYNFTIGSKNVSSPLESISQLESTPEGGSLVQTIKFNGTKPVYVNFTPSDLGNWSLDSEITLKNGTKYNIVIPYFNNETGLAYEVDPSQVEQITFVKVRHLGSNSSVLNLTINEFIRLEETNSTAPKRISYLGGGVYEKLVTYIKNSFWAIVNLTGDTVYQFNLTPLFSKALLLDFFVYNMTNISGILTNATFIDPNTQSRLAEVWAPISGEYLVEFITYDEILLVEFEITLI